ncbi:MAG: 6-bladed beta-propeller, partial [Deltaproteobacteria bacterium]
NVRLALDSSGFYVMDPATFSVLRFDEDGKYLGRFGRISGLAGGFSQISDIYIDKKNGRVVIVDYNRVAVIFFNRNGDFLFEFGGPSMFKMPTVAAVDDFNKVYVADSNMIRVFKIEEERFEEPKVDVEPESKPEPEPGPEPESKPAPEAPAGP